MTFTPDRKRQKSQRRARCAKSDSPTDAGSPAGAGETPSNLSEQLKEAGFDLTDHQLAGVFESLDPVSDEENPTADESPVDHSSLDASAEVGRGEEEAEQDPSAEAMSVAKDTSALTSPHPLLTNETWTDLTEFAPEVSGSLTALMSLDEQLRTFDRPMGPDEAMHLIDGAEAISRVTDALSTLALSVYERIGTPVDSGAKDTKSLIKDRLNLTPHEANRRARLAKDLGGRVNMEGQALPPKCPVVADKLHDGTLSSGQVAAIEECLGALPDWTDHDVRTKVETDLVNYAPTVSIADLREIFRQMLARIDPDGAAPKDPSDRSMYFINARPKRNGDWKVEGILDPVAGSELHGLLTSRIESSDELSGSTSGDATAAAAEGNAAANGSAGSDGSDLVDGFVVGESSDSTGDAVAFAPNAGIGGVPGQEQFEIFDSVLTGDRYDAPSWAVVDAVGTSGGTAEHSIPAGHGVREDGSTVNLVSEQPSARNWIYERFATLISRISMKEAQKGSPYALVVTAKAEDLAENSGEGTTGSGNRIPIDELTKRGLNGTVFFHLMDEKARTVEVRTEKRFANNKQIAIITARDKGCTFPGCDAPAGWCDANHVVPHGDGGETDINNLCLACSAHHHLLDRSEWEVRMLFDGRPAWVPPTSIDPAQRPILHSRFLAEDIIGSLFDE